MALHAVSALDDDSPSMAWRSTLNQRLSQVSSQRRAAVYWRFGAAASAIAAASVLVVSFIQPFESPSQPPTRVATESSVEEAILTDHENQMGQASVGVHVSFNEAGS
jgi:negative regulator of sigma E activity